MTTATLTLTEFLLARIAEDEREATACLDQYMRGDGGTKSRWVRQLAECEAKRRIVEEHGPFWEDDSPSLCRVCHDYAAHDAAASPCRTLRLLATVYADHPDYRQEWRP